MITVNDKSQFKVILFFSLSRTNVQKVKIPIIRDITAHLCLWWATLELSEELTSPSELPAFLPTSNSRPLSSSTRSCCLLRPWGGQLLFYIPSVISDSKRLKCGRKAFTIVWPSRSWEWNRGLLNGCSVISIILSVFCFTLDTIPFSIHHHHHHH